VTAKRCKCSTWNIRAVYSVTFHTGRFNFPGRILALWPDALEAANESALFQVFHVEHCYDLEGRIAWSRFRASMAEDNPISCDCASSAGAPNSCGNVWEPT
jgi:hypothetical protein